jgi:hypothetical protein
MSPTQCANCKRENPPASKFCNGCGAPLHLLSCQNCGAVNEAGATTCHRCMTALSEGETGSVALSSIEANALDSDAKFHAALQALRERLPMMGAEYAQAPAADREGVDAPADELGPEMGTAHLTDTSTRYPTTDIALPSGQPGHRVGRVRPATVVFGTAALAAAGVAILYTFDHRELADASTAPFAATELKGKANSAASTRQANPDATDTVPVAASLPRVTHGVAKSAAPVAAAATNAGPFEGGAPRPNPSAVQRETRVTSVTPAGDSLPRVTHGVAKSAAAAPAAAAAAVPPEREPPQTGATTAQRENRATSVAPAAGVSVPPRAVESGTGIERPPPALIGPCTEAVATLGLCNPEPTQRRE